jgi:hypothetical protein
MVRKRLAFLTAIAGLGLLGGCSSTPSCPGEQRPSFFDRFRRHPAPECCVENGAMMTAPVADGPVLSDGAVVAPPPASGGGACLQPAPVPSLSQPQRLVPQPQAQPRGFVPQ